jgi:anti-sigma regulatory factor (Ser/Thr protein kinase)
VQSPVTEIRAAGISVLTSTVDLANARLEFENGCIANFTASRMSLKCMRRFRLFQPDAYLAVDFEAQELTIALRQEGAQGLIPGVALDIKRFPKEDVLLKEIQAFVHAVRDGAPVPVSGGDGRAALKLAHDIIAALRTKVYACFALPVPATDLRAAIREALMADGWQSGIEVESAVPNWVALRVSCRRVNAERLTHFMNELAGDLPETDRHQLVTAFREVLLNAMEHGAGFDPRKVVEVAAVRTQRTLVYYFKDPGPGFDVHAPRLVAKDDDPISHLDVREAEGKRAGGFGLLLTAKLVDEVHFNERGNEVILVKHLD